MEHLHNFNEADPLLGQKPYIHGHSPRLVEFKQYRWPFVAYELSNVKHLMFALATITFRVTTLVVVVLSIISVYLCYIYNLTAEIPTSIIIPAIVFPISFSLSYTISRRENTLHDLASLKATAVCLYVCTREWAPVHKKTELTKRIKETLSELFFDISKFLAHEQNNVSRIYRDFDILYRVLEELRTTDVWINSVISRPYQYVRFMMLDFERLRVIHDFRQPATFHGFTLFYCLVFPVLFAPNFARVAMNYDLWAGIYSSVLASVVMISLYNINHDEEDPFDGIGFDDLDIHLIEEAPLHMWREDLDSW